MGICLYRGARAMPYGHDRHLHTLHDRVAGVASTGAAYRSGVAADVAHGCGLWFCAQPQRLLQTSGNILPRMKDLPGLGARIGRACSQIICLLQSFTATAAGVFSPWFGSGGCSHVLESNRPECDLKPGVRRQPLGRRSPVVPARPARGQRRHRPRSAARCCADLQNGPRQGSRLKLGCAVVPAYRCR